MTMLLMLMLSVSAFSNCVDYTDTGPPDDTGIEIIINDVNYESNYIVSVERIGVSTDVSGTRIMTGIMKEISVGYLNAEQIMSYHAIVNDTPEVVAIWPNCNHYNLYDNLKPNYLTLEYQFYTVDKFQYYPLYNWFRQSFNKKLKNLEKNK